MRFRRVRFMTVTLEVLRAYCLFGGDMIPRLELPCESVCEFYRGKDRDDLGVSGALQGPRVWTNVPVAMRVWKIFRPLVDLNRVHFNGWYAIPSDDLWFRAARTPKSMKAMVPSRLKTAKHLSKRQTSGRSGPVQGEFWKSVALEPRCICHRVHGGGWRSKYASSGTPSTTTKLLCTSCFPGRPLQTLKDERSALAASSIGYEELVFSEEYAKVFSI
ncbi:hypothetical protein BU23DRAFT_569071 [Bimuria novae-zelandiae CBS 107.79]|uniref:Uncharacterized protein n=1 Tax=Bimuria novae-zelandiae CBS 107.79 TaxID=1447943 RepID=A0A6A5V8E5_9PLEO|nr:hypothetical protein BU23DRAFT_569071 [Bimuria novae-zelandiae CBS 107.79]